MTADLKLNAKAALMVYLYEPAQRYLEKVLNRLVLINNQINGAGSIPEGGIIYGGKSYVSYQYPSLGESYYLLDTQLIPEMEEYLTNVKALKKERDIISRFLTILLTKSSNGEILKEALGENLFNQIYYPTWRNNLDSAMPDAELKRFIRDNKQYFKIMQDRVVTNLIEKSLYESNSN